MYEFIALRVKSYAFTIYGQSTPVKAKGIRTHVTIILTIEDHKKCLFEDSDAVDDDDDDGENIKAVSMYRDNIYTLL